MCQSVCVNRDEVKSGPVRCGCGGKALIETVTTRFEAAPRFRVRCEKCNVSTIWDYFAKDDAVRAWNEAMGAFGREEFWNEYDA